MQTGGRRLLFPTLGAEPGGGLLALDRTDDAPEPVSDLNGCAAGVAARIDAADPRIDSGRGSTNAAGQLWNSPADPAQKLLQIVHAASAIAPMRTDAARCVGSSSSTSPPSRFITKPTP